MGSVTVTSPDGVDYEINAPDDATDEQIMQYAEEQFASGALSQIAEPEAIETVDGFPAMPEGFKQGELHPDPDLDRKLAQREWSKVQTQESFKRGDIGVGQAVANDVGDAVGKATDSIFQPIIKDAGEIYQHGKDLSDAIVSGVKTVVGEDNFNKGIDAAYGVVNQVQEVIKSGGEIAKDVENKARESSQLIDLQMQGNEDITEHAKSWVAGNASELYDWWKGLNKETRKTVFAGTNIAAVIPGLGQATSKIVSPIFNTTGKLVTGQLNRQLAKSADDLVLAVDKKSRLARRQATGTGGYKLNPVEQSESAAVQKVKGFDPQKSVEFNNSVIVDAQRKAGTLMDAEIKKHGTTIDPIRTDVALNLNFNKLKADTAEFVSLPNKVTDVPKRLVNDIIRKANKDINGNPATMTTASLHKARQELGKKIDWKRDINITDETYKEAYNTLNKLIDDSMPMSKLPEHRNTYHQLVKVNGKLAARAEANSAEEFRHIWDYVSKGAKGLWAAKTIDKVALAGTVAASGAGAGTFASILAGGWAATRGVSIVRSVKLKRLMIETLGQTNKMLKTATAADRKNLIEVKRYLIKNIAASQASANKEQEK